MSIPLSALRGKFQVQAAQQIYSNGQNKTDRLIQDAIAQCDKAPALGTAVQREKESVPSVTVCFTGYRVRPLDPDNFAGSVKDLLDGLRHAKLISGDEYWRISLETKQVKVSHYEEERTVIEISIE